MSMGYNSFYTLVKNLMGHRRLYLFQQGQQDQTKLQMATMYRLRVMPEWFTVRPSFPNGFDWLVNALPLNHDEIRIQ